MPEGRGWGDADLWSVTGRAYVNRCDLAAHEAPSQFDGIDDLYVASAAAQIVPQCALDLLGRRVGVHIQEGLGGHDHTGDAEAALHGASEYEGLLDQVRILRRAKALDRGDVRLPPAERLW